MKKIFSIILCAALLMGLIPTSVFASSGALSAVQVTCDNPYLDVGQDTRLSVTLLDGENNPYEGNVINLSRIKCAFCFDKILQSYVSSYEVTNVLLGSDRLPS